MRCITWQKVVKSGRGFVRKIQNWWYQREINLDLFIRNYLWFGGVYITNLTFLQ
jgi:hypothetical protein